MSNLETALVVFIVVMWLASGGLAGFVAEEKGYSGGLWVFLALVFGIAALVAAAGLPTRRQPDLLDAHPRACPDCAEPVRILSRVCPHCGLRFNDADVCAELERILMPPEFPHSEAEDPRILARRIDGHTRRPECQQAALGLRRIGTPKALLSAVLHGPQQEAESCASDYATTSDSTREARLLDCIPSAPAGRLPLIARIVSQTSGHECMRALRQRMRVEMRNSATQPLEGAHLLLHVVAALPPEGAAPILADALAVSWLHQHAERALLAMGGHGLPALHETCAQADDRTAKRLRKLIARIEAH